MKTLDQRQVAINMLEWYEQAFTQRDNLHPQTVGRFVHWSLAAWAGGSIEYESLESKVEPYLKRELVLEDLTGHIGHEPITFTPSDISVETEYGSRGITYGRLFLPQIPHPHYENRFRQFTFRLDRNDRPTFQVYAETGS